MYILKSLPKNDGMEQNQIAPYLLILIVLFLIIPLYASASNITVTGKVFDRMNEPIVGATVVLNKNESVGTITDLNGFFLLKVPENSFIKISSIGYGSKLLKVVNGEMLVVYLDDDVKVLNEVVVTALGITRDSKSLSYARQAIETESMVESRGSGLLDMLSGKAAGMQVVSGGGPLASTGIRIRGNNSLTGNNQPLYVIDGVPIVNDSGESGDLDYGNILNGMNPDEIENIEILKGANASALYGSDAANGVVLITTKKGTKKKGLGVDYGINLMMGTLYNFPTYQNIYGTGQNGRFQKGYNYYGASGGTLSYDPSLPYGIYSANLAGANQRSWGMPMLGFNVVGRNNVVKPYAPALNTVENMFQTSTSMTNSLSLDNATESSTFRFSYTNTHSNDILKNYNIYSRHNFNLRATTKLSSWLNFDSNVRYMYENVNNRGFRGNSNRNPVFVSMSLPRDITLDELLPWKNPDGTALSRSGFINPYWLLNELSNADNRHWLTGNITLNVTLPYNFSFRFRASTDVQNFEAWSFTNYNSPFDIDGSYQISTSKSFNNNFDGLLQYKKRLKETSIDGTIGVSHQEVDYNRLNSSIDVLMEADKPDLSNNAGTVKSLQEYRGKIKQAVFGTFNMGFKDWLYFDGTVRNEWSSTLSPSNWSYFYYSVGASLIITDLIKINKKILSFAKLRASYAQVGNDTNFDMLYAGFTYGGTFNDITYYNGESTNKNPFIKPERTYSSEFGGEFRFLDNRISADITYYDKKTKDQIVSADVALASGYSRRIINAGEMQNRGFEVSLNVNLIKTKNFNWSSTLNWAKNNSLVVSLPDDIRRFVLGTADKGTVLYAEVGMPYGVLYGNDYERDANGNVYVGLTGIPKYKPDQYLCKVEADWFGGWKNTISIKNFTVNCMIDFQKGGNVWSYTAFRGGIDGNTVQSLRGRQEYEFSMLVLGENDDERKGLMTPGFTVQPNADFYENHVIYEDYARPKGVQLGESTVYDLSENYWGGKPSLTWVAPMQYWTHNNSTSMRAYIYDASYIKLREVSIGYSLPKKMLNKISLNSAKFSLVGRNVAILFQNTPKGVDPQATSTVGNARGFENSYAFPMSNWGFDLKISF